MSDQIVSLIRTYVPVGVGAALTWLATTLGVGVGEEASTGLTVGVVALVTAVYYAAARWAEGRVPWLGVLLGSRRVPSYPPPEPAAKDSGTP